MQVRTGKFYAESQQLRVKEAVQQPDMSALSLAAGHLGMQVGQVLLEQRPVHVAEPGDVHRRGGEELSEPFNRADCPAAGLQAEPGTDPPAGPPFGQLFEPRLGNAVESQRLAALEAKGMQAPDVSAVLGVPAAASVGQVLELTAGKDKQGPRVGVLGSGTADPLPPCLLRPVEQ